MKFFEVTCFSGPVLETVNATENPKLERLRQIDPELIFWQQKARKLVRLWRFYPLLISFKFYSQISELDDTWQLAGISIWGFTLRLSYAVLFLTFHDINLI